MLVAVRFPFLVDVPELELPELFGLMEATSYDGVCAAGLPGAARNATAIAAVIILIEPRTRNPEPSSNPAPWTMDHAPRKDQSGVGGSA